MLFFSIFNFSQEKLNGTYNKEFKLFITKNKDSIYFVDDFKYGKGVFFNKENINLQKLLNNQYETKEFGKCGLIDSTGRIILSKNFDKIVVLNDSLARLSNENKQWLYNLKQKKSVSKKYDVLSFIQENKFVEVGLGNMYGTIDLNGKEILNVEYSIVFPYYKDIVVVKKNQKYGCFNTNGKVLLPIEYKDVFAGEKYIMAKKDIGYEVFNKEGNFITHLNYSRVKELDNNFFAIEDYYRTYLYDLKNTKIITKENYSDLGIDSFDRNRNKHLRAVEYQKHGMKIGFVDYNLNVVLPIEYDIGNFTNGFATIGKDDKFGFINEDKQIVVPLIFDKVWSFFDGVAKAIYHGKNVYIDTSGKILFYSDINPETTQESIGFFYEGFAKKIKNNQYSFVNKLGEELQNLKFDFVDKFNDNKAFVFKNTIPYFINKKGKKIE